jgi:hypothetical protein
MLSKFCVIEIVNEVIFFDEGDGVRSPTQNRSALCGYCNFYIMCKIKRNI